MARHTVTFEIESNSTDMADILEGVIYMLADFFPSGQFYGGLAEVDEDTITVEETNAND